MDDCFTESLFYSESDNSDPEEIKKPTPTPENCISPIGTSTENQSQNEKMSFQSDEEDINNSIRKIKKNPRILSSDEEESNDQTLNSLGPISNEKKGATIIRPSICDSDTKSSSDDNEIDSRTPKMMKKLKKKKKKKQNTRTNSDNSQSESESDSETEKDNTTKSSRKKNSSSQSSNSSNADSNDDNDEKDEDGIQNFEPREKPVQRVILKASTIIAIKYCVPLHFNYTNSRK